MQRKLPAHTNLQGELKAFSYPSPLPAPLLHKHSHSQSSASVTDMMLPRYHYCVHNFAHHTIYPIWKKCLSLSMEEELIIHYSLSCILILIRNPYTSVYIPYTQYIYVIYICHVHQYIQYTYLCICVYKYMSICLCLCIYTCILSIKMGFSFIFQS